MKNFNQLNNIVVRTLSHSNSSRKIISRTEEDNKDLGEVVAETFTNRNGKNIVNTNDDILPAMAGKKPVKPEKGMRKFKGSKTIRKDIELIEDSNKEDEDYDFE